MKPLDADSSVLPSERPSAAPSSSPLPDRINLITGNTRYLPAAGRILIGGIFAVSGLTKAFAYAGTTAAIAAAGLPFAPLGWAIAVAVEVGLGLLLLLGWRARLAAAALALWCFATAVFFHRDFADQNMMIHFLKNLMIAGGLLQVMHFGAGAFSLDARRSVGGRS